MLTRTIETAGGLIRLAMIAARTGFSFRGPYWKWRMATAFGAGPPLSRRERVHALLTHARWVHRMKRNA